MKICHADASHAEAISQLLASLGYGGMGCSVLDKIDLLRSHQDALLFTAMEGDNCLGFISLHFIPQIALKGDVCRISYLCVSPNTRGKGVGAALEQTAEKVARLRGCDRIEVHCHERRERAYQFYFGQGYAESPKYLLKSLVDADACNTGK